MSTSTTHQNKNYFLNVVNVTKKYLGPAAERFIRRQIEFHIKKVPENIDFEDISKIKNSVSVALGLLVDDKSMVDKAIQQLEEIEK